VYNIYIRDSEAHDLGTVAPCFDKTVDTALQVLYHPQFTNKQRDSEAMRCKACNSELNNFESTRKSSVTGEFLDLCNTCYKSVSNDIQAVERYDLMDVNDEVDSYDNQ